MSGLDGKVVVLTGAAGGMGRPMSLALAAAGARVAAVDRDAGGLAMLQGAADGMGIGGNLALFPADLADRSACEDVMPRVYDALGDLHGLVNLAGIGTAVFDADFSIKPVRFWECEIGAWQTLMDINVRAAWILAGAATRHMLRRRAGRIVNVTTSFDTMLQPNNAAYGQSKAALEAATASWARELAGSGITVNALAPGGPTNTGLIPRNSPMPRDAMIQPEVMGPPLVWLMGDAAAGFSNRRVVARLWDVRVPGENAAAAAWPGYGTQSIRPKVD